MQFPATLTCLSRRSTGPWRAAAGKSCSRSSHQTRTTAVRELGRPRLSDTSPPFLGSRAEHFSKPGGYHDVRHVPDVASISKPSNAGLAPLAIEVLLGCTREATRTIQLRCGLSAAIPATSPGRSSPGDDWLSCHSGHGRGNCTNTMVLSL